jgi:hypothetical protein
MNVFMSARTDRLIRSGEKPDAGARSSYSTERSPVTALLLAGKKNVILPLIPSADDQLAPAKPLESNLGEERPIQE